MKLMSADRSVEIVDRYQVTSVDVSGKPSKEFPTGNIVLVENPVYSSYQLEFGGDFGFKEPRWDNRELTWLPHVLPAGPEERKYGNPDLLGEVVLVQNYESQTDKSQIILVAPFI